MGVVGDVKVRGLERRSEPQVYLPNRQQPEDAMGWYTPQDLAVRHAGDAAALVPALRRIVARADPSSPSRTCARSRRSWTTQTAPRRVQVRVLAGFAALAVLLAGVGIHGLLAFTVASRAQEIGVRRALGARASDIAAAWCCGQGARLAVAGVGLGLVARVRGRPGPPGAARRREPARRCDVRRRRRAWLASPLSPAACCLPGAPCASTRAR